MQATLGYEDTIAIGAQKGLEECRRQFSWEKWNCPQNVFTHLFSNNNLPCKLIASRASCIINEKLT